MFRDAEISPPTFTVLSHFKSSHKNATETFFLQAVPFCVSFVVLTFLTDSCTLSTSTSLSMYLKSWVVCLFVCFLFFFLFLPAFLLHPSLGTKTSFAGLPSSSHAQVFLTDSWLLSLPASLSHQALYLLSASTTRPHPVSPCC